MAASTTTTFLQGRLTANGSARIATLTSLICLAGLTSCATIKIKVRPDSITKDGIESAQFLRRSEDGSRPRLVALALSGTDLLKKGAKLMRSDAKDDAAACFIKAAYDAQELLASEEFRSQPEVRNALLALHNSSLARFAETWATDPRRAEGLPTRLTIDGQTFELVADRASDYPEGFFDRAIASESVSGRGVVESGRAGYGAPLVGIREQRPERSDEMRFYSKLGLHVPVTLVMGTPSQVGSATNPVVRVPISVLNPMLHETVTVRGFDLPLAANFATPFEVLLDGRNQSLDSIAGFFGADERIKDSGIFLIEPYDPKRIPIILTHGLVSVPIIWRDLVAELMANPEISRRYQFMVFKYPSSYAITESALLYRKQLAALREHLDPDGSDPLSTNVVAIGHSMGGILTHLLVADIGDNLWKQVSDKPIDELGWGAEATEKARELAFFEADSAVSRAIFIATPHGGATKAEKSLSGMVSRLVKMPSEVVNTMTAFVALPDTQHLKIDLGEKATSIQSLKPNSPVVKALALSPYHPGVTYHSIIGDRGKGDTPNSSDGMVEYWSSHQEGAASELIVPYSHSAYKHPLAVAEVERILLLHVGLAPQD